MRILYSPQSDKIGKIDFLSCDERFPEKQSFKPKEMSIIFDSRIWEGRLVRHLPYSQISDMCSRQRAGGQSPCS
jgi:hypothetical protein